MADGTDPKAVLNENQQNDEDMDSESTSPVPPSSFTFPTRESSMRKKPGKQVSNPHQLLPAFEPAGPDDLGPLAVFQRNTGSWEKVVLPLEFLLENLENAQRDTLMANPGSYMIFVVFNGGPKIFEVCRNAVPTIQAKLKQYYGADIPIVRGNPLEKRHENRDKFTPPFILIAEVDNASTRDSLIRQQTFAFTSELAIHAVPIDATTRSWAIGMFRSSRVGDTKTVGGHIRWMVMHDLWHNRDFRRLIDRATQSTSSDPLDKRVLDATQTIDARFIEHDAENPSHLWLLMIAPCTTDFALFEEIKCYIRSKPYHDGIHTLEPYRMHDNGKRAYCVICKLETHPSFNCSFVKKDSDWWGPAEQLNSKGPAGSRGRGRNSSRGGRGNSRGRGGRGRY
jgi:hypothetical protein